MVTIHRAQTEDTLGIKAVLTATWRDTYLSFLSESVLAKIGAEWHSPKVLEAEINRPTIFAGVAKTPSSDVVGMITAHLQGEILFVARLYVLPDFQRQGIGRALLEESYRAFPKAPRVRLAVEEQNPKGRAFYRKLGFSEIGLKSDDVAGTKLSSILMERVV